VHQTKEGRNKQIKIVVFLKIFKNKMHTQNKNKENKITNKTKKIEKQTCSRIFKINQDNQS
jgi:hypothetical protein